MTIFTKQFFQLKTREGPPEPTGPPSGAGPPGCGPPSGAGPPGKKIRPLRCRDGPEWLNKKLRIFFKQNMNETRFTIMKTLRQSKLWWLPVIAMLWGVSISAHALGTASGTSIGNRAYIDYDVGGTAQTQIGSSLAGNTSGAGSDTTFVVDNRVDLSLVETNSTWTTGAAGQAGRVTTFTLTNEGNTVQDYSFAAVNDVGSTLFADTDDSNVTITGIFVEDGTTPGTYEVLEDTATFVDELAANGTVTIYVVATIPGASVDTNYAIIDLTATTRDGGAGGQGAVTAATVGADTIGLPVDIVFADGYDDGGAGGLDGDTNDAANDGAFTASDAYLVASAILTVTKTSAVVSDPINGTGADRKRIPGAVIRYTIVVANSGTTAASNVTLVDAIPANTTYVAESMNLDTVGQTDADVPATDLSDYNVTNLGSVTSIMGTVAAAGSSTFYFDVTID